MADREKFYITTAISYPNGAPAYRPRLRGRGLGRDRALQAHRRLRRVLHDRHGRARPQDPADRRPERHDAEGLRRRDGGEVPRHGRRASTAPTTASSAPPTPTTCPRPRSSGAGCRTSGDIYLSKYSGWYSVRDEAYYDESELTQPARRLVARADRHAGRMDRGGELLLPALGLPGPAARALRSGSRTSSARRRGATRSSASCARACRTSRSAARPSTGACRSRATPSTSCMSGSTRSTTT